jgi:hypothetical protein
MSSLRELLDRAGRSAGTSPSADTVEADVLRGRAALARRRRRRSIGLSLGGIVAAFALVGTLIAVGGSGGPDEVAPPARVASPSAAGVRLVNYTGEQPNGFIVSQVPEGWYIQRPDHPEYSLTIAPQGDTTSPDAFDGKLVVMLLSRSARQELPNGEPVKVGEYDGVVTRSPEAATLTYQDGDGHFVQVQAWNNLGWTNEQLAQFAEGVEVTANAQAGVG